MDFSRIFGKHHFAEEMEMDIKINILQEFWIHILFHSFLTSSDNNHFQRRSVRNDPSSHTLSFIQDWVEGSPDKYNNIIEEKEINGILYPVLFFICITRGHFSFFPSDHISSTHTYTTYHILPLLYIRISLFNSASSNQMLQQPQASKNRGNFLFFGMRVRNVWPDFFDERLRACLLA